MEKRNLRLILHYKVEYPWCELLGYLEGETWEKKILEYNDFFGVKYPEHWPADTLELHHIYGGVNRWDIWGNIIHISAAAHTYAHEHPQEARIAALYVKHIKGELNEENLSLMRDKFRFCPIARIETYDIKEDWLLEMRDALIGTYT